MPKRAVPAIKILLGIFTLQSAAPLGVDDEEPEEELEPSLDVVPGLGVGLAAGITAFEFDDDDVVIGEEEEEPVSGEAPVVVPSMAPPNVLLLVPLAAAGGRTTADDEEDDDAEEVVALVAPAPPAAAGVDVVDDRVMMVDEPVLSPSAGGTLEVITIMLEEESSGLGKIGEGVIELSGGA